MIVMPRFLDIEASSLNDSSYPIEIAWSYPLGDIESHLINPYFIDNWTDWSFKSQQIHNISRKQLREEGISPRAMCTHMIKSISPGEIIYADGGIFDENWINVVFLEGLDAGVPPFTVKHSDTVMITLLEQIENDPIKRWKLYGDLKVEARKMVDGQHRAKVDVEYLIELWKLCLIMSQNI